MKNYLVIASCIFVSLSCSHTSPSEESVHDSLDLEAAITSLSDAIDINDARLISKTLIVSTSDLAHLYRMASPPRYHNLLVHMGLKPRGLCCHWAEDLHSRLIKVNQQTVKFDWLVARHGSLLGEHTAIVLYAENKGWQQGMVYDPWRRVGQPFWIRVGQDKYPWELHPLSGQWDDLHCE